MKAKLVGLSYCTVIVLLVSLTLTNIGIPDYAWYIVYGISFILGWIADHIGEFIINSFKT